MSITLKKNSLFIKDGGEYKDIAVFSAPWAVEKWLDDHPEITTSIQDGEVTFSKLNSTVQDRISGTESDVSTLQSGLSSEASARNAADTNLNNQISALRGAVGSPLVAATAAAMTDTDKIYVYTGDQSGYTNGNWYYYSGAAWVSGGVYNETALETDKTLVIEDKAADAKITGEKINKIQSELILSTRIGVEILYRTNDTYPYGFRSGFYNYTNGESSTSGNYTRTIYPIDIPDFAKQLIVETAVPNESVSIIVFNTNTPRVGSGADNSDFFVRGYNFSNKIKITLNKNEYYFICTTVNSVDMTESTQPIIQIYSESTASINKNEIAIDNLQNDIYDNMEGNVNIYQAADSIYPLGWRTGGITKTNGKINSSTVSYLITSNRISLPYEKIIITPPTGYSIDIFEYDPIMGYIGYTENAIEYLPKSGMEYILQLGVFNDSSEYLTENFLNELIITWENKGYKFAQKTDLENFAQKTDLENIDNFVKYRGTFDKVKYIIDVPQPESMAIVDETTLIWAMDDAKYSTTNLRLYTFSPSMYSTPTQRSITHHLGHLNTIDYRNGALIFGNGGSGNYNGGSKSSPGNGAIYIINDFLNVFESHYQSKEPLELSEAITISCDINTETFSDDSKFNVIFGETNIEMGRTFSNSIIYLITSRLGKAYYNCKIRRIMLGIGSNQLENGSYLQVEDGKYNGTYKILETYTGISDGTDFCNDISYVNGRIVANVGENILRLQEFQLNKDGTITKIQHQQVSYDNNGNAIKSWTSGITTLNHELFLGFSSGGIGIFNAEMI